MITLYVILNIFVNKLISYRLIYIKLIVVYQFINYLKKVIIVYKHIYIHKCKY